MFRRISFALKQSIYAQHFRAVRNTHWSVCNFRVESAHQKQLVVTLMNAKAQIYLYGSATHYNTRTDSCPFQINLSTITVTKLEGTAISPSSLTADKDNCARSQDAQDRFPHVF